MRRRLAMVLLGVVVALLIGPTAFAQSGETLQGTLRGPTGKPVKGVTITVSQDGSEVGRDTTAADGAWSVDLPGPGSYTVTLDVSTLPKGLQPRNRGGQTLHDVAVTRGQQRTVIFPLIPSSQPQQGPLPSQAPGAQPPPPAQQGGGGPSLAAQAAQLFVAGIKYGVIIAITAIGLSLVFGTTGLINFAHGELVTIGAVVAFYFNAAASGPGLSLVVAALCAVVLGGVLGGVLQTGLWRPLNRRGTGLIQLFIISIGLSLLLRHLILVVYGSRSQPYGQYVIQRSLHLGPVSITPRDLFIIGISLAILVAVALMLQMTRAGKAMRAVSDNRDLALASGIDVEHVIVVVWVLAGALAAIGGVFFGMVSLVAWDMGFKLLLLMFAAIILGGLGSAYGAMVGGLVVGIVAQMSTLFSSAELQNAWALLVLIIVLLVRPQGILGRRERIG